MRGSTAGRGEEGSRQSRRRLFERLEQEEQRLNKHDGRWMDSVRLLQLESFILTKLTKPSVPVNLVGPTASLSTHSLLPMVSFVAHVDHAVPGACKVVDDGEAPDGNDSEIGKRGSGVAD